MIDKSALENFINKKLEGTDLFLVDISVSEGNIVKVELDSDTSVDIDECVKLTREIESEFDRDKEDYELEVGSVGITSPLKMKRQYTKYVGKEMELVTKDGKKLKGMLKAADPETFVIESEEKVKAEGSKRPVVEKVDHTFGYGDVKQIKYLLKF